MPIHDWSRVGAGIFHDFHLAWIAAIRNALNEGVLPPDYYALAEQVIGNLGPDVLTLQEGGRGGGDPSEGIVTGALAVATAPPKVRFTAIAELTEYARKRRSLAIRHTSDDRIVALIEILSPGNKASRYALRTFVEKAAEALARGYHLLLVDLHRPTPRDPQGIHGAVWAELGEESYYAPPDKPLTLVAYSAGRPETAYIEPIAVGDPLPEMPLFLGPESYVNVPLEATYQATYRGVPRRWREVLEALPA
jgi:hypothetical protein